MEVVIPTRQKQVKFVEPPVAEIDDEEPDLSEILEEVLEGPEPIESRKTEDKRENPANATEEAAVKKEVEKHKSYQRISKLKDLLSRNPGWRSLWKKLLPEELLATNEAWQKDLLENLRAKNVKVNQQTVESDEIPEYHASEDTMYYSINLQNSSQLPLGSVVCHDLVEQLFNHTGYAGPY